MKGLSPSSWLKEHALLRAHTWTESWKGKGRAHWTQIFTPSLDWASSWTPVEHEMAFHGINQGEHFIYCHFMHALMSTCDPMLFKFSSIGIRALHGWHLSCMFGLFRVSRFLVWKPFFFSFFFRLVLILGFQARLRLETCREYCLEQNPSFLWFFGAHLIGFQKLGLILVLHFMYFFLCNFWV